VGHFSATARAVFVEGDKAYLAAGGQGLKIIDVSDPSAPTQIGAYQAASSIRDVAVAGELAVALDDAGDVLLIEVSRHAAPFELGRYKLPELGHQVLLADGYAYIPAGESGLHILDISRPDAPRRVGHHEEPTTSLAVAGDYAYSFGSASISIIDLSEPRSPTALDPYYRLLWGWGPHGITIEDRLYVMVHVGTDWAYVKTFDISDPTRLVPIHTADDMPVDVFEMRGHSLGLAAGEDRLYVASDWGVGLRTIDISDPERPIEIGFHEKRTYGRELVIVDGYVYVTDPGNGLFIFKTHPVEIPKPSLRADLVGHSGGAAGAIFVDENYAYLGFGPELAVLDVADPSDPRRVGYLVLPTKDHSTISAMSVISPYVYVTDDHGLWVVDVSDPSQPTALGHSLVPGGWNTGLKASGGYVYLAQWYNSGQPGSGNVGHGYFKVVDVSEPADLLEVYSFKTSAGGGRNRGARAVRVADNYAYVADSQEYGLRAFDISDPTQPVEVGFSAGGAEEFVLRDGYAYLTNGLEGGFRVIDVSDPATLNTLGMVETPGRTWDVALVHDYAIFVEDSPLVDWEPVGDYGLRILDISNPISPTSAGFYTTTGHIDALATRGDHAYLTLGGDLRILDLSDPTAPVEIGAYQNPPSVSEISVDDEVLYVLGEGQPGDQVLHTVDISDPHQPKTITRTTISLGLKTPVVDGYAYVADKVKLRILDASNPASLTQVSVYTTPHPIHKLLTRGDMAYLALDGGYSYAWQLVALDLSDPTKPIQSDEFELLPNLQALDIGFVDEYLYVVSYPGGLLVFDVSEPRNLVEADIGQKIFGQHLAVRDDYAYLAGQGLNVLDVSDPARPALVGATGMGLFGTRWSITGIAVDENYAYLIDDEVGLRVFDISDPGLPVEVAFSLVPGHPADLAVTEEHILVATRNNGLFLFQLSPRAETPPPQGILGSRPPSTPRPAFTPTMRATPTPTSTPAPVQSQNIEVVESFTDRIDMLSIQGDYAYAVADTRLLVMGISDRVAPVIVGKIELPGSIEDMEIVDDTAYLTVKKTGLSLVSLADSENPTELGRFDLDSDWINCVISGDYAYLAADDGLHIVDVAAPASPGQVGFLPEPDMWRTTLSEGYAFVIGRSGLYAIDISDPSAPTRVGVYRHPSGAVLFHTPTMVGDYAFVPDSQLGLQTIDFSDPAWPFRAKADIRQHGLVAVKGDSLFALGRDGLQVVDISNPAAPRKLGRLELGPEARSVRVEGDYAFLTEGYRDTPLMVVDLSDPLAPTQVALSEPLEYIKALAVVDEYVYVAGGDDGFFILQFTVEE
jgi:hypothetical protein